MIRLKCCLRSESGKDSVPLNCAATGMIPNQGGGGGLLLKSRLAHRKKSIEFVAFRAALPINDLPI